MTRLRLRGAGAARTDTAFIRSHTAPARPPFVPEISLHLALAESLDLWEATQEASSRPGIGAPFWGFAWAGGQGLARHLLDHPALVAGRHVLDIGCGSGLVAIAAARAGAAAVRAVDLDPLAVTATRLNAAANRVRVDARRADAADVAVGREDVVTVGDLHYDLDVATSMGILLDRARSVGATVLVGDPFRGYLPLLDLVELATYQVPVNPDLESASTKPVLVGRLADRSVDR